MILTPVEPVGFKTRSMEVVICPACNKKRWANMSHHKPGKARTTCSVPRITG